MDNLNAISAHFDKLDNPYMILSLDTANGATIMSMNGVSKDNVIAAIENAKNIHTGRNLVLQLGNSSNGRTWALKQEFAIKGDVPETAVNGLGNNATTPAIPAMPSAVQNLDRNAVSDALMAMQYQMVVPGLQSQVAELKQKVSNLEFERNILSQEKAKLLMDLATIEKEKELEYKMKEISAAKPNMMGLGSTDNPEVFNNNLKAISGVVKDLFLAKNGSGSPDMLQGLDEQKKEFVSSAVEIARTNDPDKITKLLVIINHMLENNIVDQSFQSVMGNVQKANNGGNDMPPLTV